MTTIKGLPWLLCGCSIAAACHREPPEAAGPGVGHDHPSTAPRTPVGAAIELGATPLAVDARGVPRMLAATSVAPAPAATSGDSARLHVTRLASAWGVKADALPTLQGVAVTPASGGSIARFRQLIDGLPIEDGDLRVLVGTAGELVMTTGTLIGRDAPRTANRFADDDTGAIARAVAHAYHQPFDGRVLAPRRAAAEGARIVGGRGSAIDVQLARATKVWHPIEGALVAAWVVEAYASRADSTDGDAFRTVIGGADGKVLAHRSLVADAFDYRVFAESTGELHPFDGPIVDSTPHPTGVPDGSYPAYAPSNLVSVDGLNHPMGQATPDPWLAAGRTETLGNNVEAYTDLNAPTGLTFGDFRATVTAAGAFDRAYDTGLGPLTSQGQQMAAITSLFYNMNWLHDFWYDAGFTEAAGNGQDNNYGRGGQDRDALLAEAQDNALGGSRNNANMSTPSDGLPPRMQVFLWSGKDDRRLTIQPANRTPPVGSAVFGPTSFDTTAAMILAVDGAGASPSDACEPLTNTVTGMIVLVDRGSCSFKSKAARIQTAGGVGMIVANNVAGTTPPGLGDDIAVATPITIGTLSVTQAEGATIKTELAAGAVTGALHRLAGPELDGGNDSTLIAHEFGHYLHHRLNQCGNTMCRAMSEGWGDFDALILMARAGDDLAGAYPFSVYTTISFNGDPAYFGIRRAPYSVNQAINSLSFRHMADGAPLPTTHPFLTFGNNAEVHNAGEIWAATLWEVYVALLQQPGAVFDEVRARMAKYVVSGLQMMPVDPSPMEARDALLAVASPADRAVMIEAFGRRGMGSCAVPPPPDSVNFAGIVESSAVKGRVVPGAIAIDDAVGSCDDDGVLDNGETATLTFAVANNGHAALADVTVTPTTTATGVTIVSAPVTIAALPAGGSQQISVEVKMDTTAATAVAGAFKLAIAAAGACAEALEVPFSVRLNSDEQPGASATDRFDAASVWIPSNAPIVAWTQVAQTALDSQWHGADLGTSSDTSLVSPKVTVGSGPFSVTFTHRHAFEQDATASYDGGVIEYTTDNGTTWSDVTTVASVMPGYGQALFVGSGNPLEGRLAYTGTNAASPGFDTVTLDFGTALANAELQLRFRIGSDGGVGAAGWDIDDVAFAGITGTPFPALVTDASSCGGAPDAGPGGPDAPGDPGQPGGDVGGCCDAGPLRAGNLGLALGVLALVLGRRRRR